MTYAARRPIATQVSVRLVEVTRGWKAARNAESPIIASAVKAGADG